VRRDTGSVGYGEVVPSLEGSPGPEPWGQEGKSRQQAGIITASSQKLSL